MRADASDRPSTATGPVLLNHFHLASGSGAFTSSMSSRSSAKAFRLRNVVASLASIVASCPKASEILRNSATKVGVGAVGGVACTSHQLHLAHGRASTSLGECAPPRQHARTFLGLRPTLPRTQESATIQSKAPATLLHQLHLANVKLKPYPNLLHVKRQELARKRKPPAAGPYQQEIENLANKLPRDQKCSMLLKYQHHQHQPLQVRPPRPEHPAFPRAHHARNVEVVEPAGAAGRARIIPIKPTSGKFAWYLATMESKSLLAPASKSKYLQNLRVAFGKVSMMTVLYLHPISTENPSALSHRV